MTDCNIVFEDCSLSRYHCLFTFKGTWQVKDGDGEKLSTNGTWLYAENLVEITDGMTFKAGESLFKAQLSYANNYKSYANNI